MSNIPIKEGQEEFDEYPDISTSIIPNFSQVLAQKLAPAIQPNLPGFDPHSLMVQKHKIETGEVPAPEVPAVKWPEKDIKALEDFCNQYGIIGFNPGKMPPIVALAMLKKTMGLEHANTPLSERVPYGYQKAGTPHNGSVNFPYSKPPDTRRVLNG